MQRITKTAINAAGDSIEVGIDRNRIYHNTANELQVRLYRNTVQLRVIAPGSNRGVGMSVEATIKISAGLVEASEVAVKGDVILLCFNREEVMLLPNQARHLRNRLMRKAMAAYDWKPPGAVATPLM